MELVIVLAKNDLVAKNVILAKMDSQAANVIHANKITSIIHHVKVRLNNWFLKIQSYFNLLFQIVIATLMVQPLCNVMPTVIALAKKDLLARNVILVILLAKEMST